MNGYELLWTRRAFKTFQRLDRNTQRKIRKSLRQLVDYYNGKASSMPDVKSLHGKYRGFFRLRVGSYRVIFRVEKEQLIILIVDVVPRGDPYKS